MNNSEKLEFFPELDTLDSEKLRFIRKFKQDVETLGNDYSAIQRCYELLLDLTENFPALADNSVLSGATGFCKNIIDTQYTEIIFNISSLLKANLFPALEEIIIGEEFLALQAHKEKLIIYIQQKRSILTNALESTTSEMEQILIQFLLLDMPDISGRMYHFYRNHYPRHYRR